MLPAKLTPRGVLWLAGACLLLLPTFTFATVPSASYRDAPSLRHAVCVNAAAHSLRAQPIRKSIDDNNDDQSDDLIGDSWLAPCDLPVSAVVDARIGGARGDRPPHTDPAICSFTAFDPFAPRPPPASFQL
jgi:hypothetical protein